MAVYFLDTSTLVKRNVQEAGTAWVRNLTRSGTPHDLYIARISVVEFVAAITRRERGGHLTPAQGAAVIGHFRRRVSQRYIVVQLSSALFDDASQLARRYGLRGYDAVQLAAALALHRPRMTRGLSPVTLVSADAELNRTAVAEGVLVENPNQYL
ncbi:type II toxin-antitoxin system VapC family toxin [Paludisphaera rhizosphaerae]|uniref:type II toxin-antitoxin system VapC family toxin n=1 Tax=Paludisphaera rhizosphaerae TaxID=2711216 RepID=UPI0013ED4DA6|nr:type II toxin-antitoxin system VapC family toxin [Paludisphaera rhizosphaerae]